MKPSFCSQCKLKALLGLLASMINRHGQTLKGAVYCCVDLLMNATVDLDEVHCQHAYVSNHDGSQ